MAVADHPYQHVVIVVEENHSFRQVMTDGHASTLHALAKDGLVFTDYEAITHPSQPNYFALFSGSTQGVSDNGRYTLAVPTLAGQLRQAGLSFGGFAEVGSPRKHNPWESFEDAKDVGRDMSAFPTDFERLPAVSFVVPNLDDDMHDGSIADGDAWLQQKILGYAEWAKTHHSLLIVTFDEANGNGPVPTIVVGQDVTPGISARPVNHYSLLGFIERVFGLPQLNEVGTAPLFDLAPEPDLGPWKPPRSQGGGLQRFVRFIGRLWNP